VQARAPQAVATEVLGAVGVEHPQAQASVQWFDDQEPVGPDAKSVGAKLDSGLGQVGASEVSGVQEDEMVADALGLPKPDSAQIRLSSR
jgi:hypothetical protein